MCVYNLCVCSYNAIIFPYRFLKFEKIVFSIRTCVIVIIYLMIIFFLLHACTRTHINWSLNHSYGVNKLPSSSPPFAQYWLVSFPDPTHSIASKGGLVTNDTFLGANTLSRNQDLQSDHRTASRDLTLTNQSLACAQTTPTE